MQATVQIPPDEAYRQWTDPELLALAGSSGVQPA